MRTFLLALVATIGVGGVAFAQQSPAPSPSPATVHIRNFTYVPETVTIAAGESVRFVQDDETAHTVTASDASFDSGNLAQHAVWTHAFAKAGTYAYICAYHPYMKGTIVVK